MFYKITDPQERRRMFEKLTQTRKNVQEQFLEDKIGKIESSQSLKKFFKPVTESQRELTKEIKEQLTRIRDKVLTLPTHTLAIQSAAPPLETEEHGEELMNVGPIAAEYMEKFIDPEEVDTTFGIHLDKDQNWKIGNEKVVVDDNDLIIGGEKYEGTRGLWELIVSNEPSEQNYDDGDLATYSEIMVNTNAIRRDNDPTNPRPKSISASIEFSVEFGVVLGFACPGGTDASKNCLPTVRCHCLPVTWRELAVRCVGRRALGSGFR